VTGYNSEYSDKPFQDKRDMEGGFKDSPLKLNHGLGQCDRWDERAIQHRARKLAKSATKVWAIPKLDPAIIQAYKPQAEPTGYSIEDHPHLAAGPMREVFEAFRREVLALDPVVTEQFLKLYVAYKAETNFVDVVPQASRLRLSLNMKFAEINDPRGICRDVTGIGRWGNGDVEVDLSTLEDLPYVMGLVRQGLEQQMGDSSL
jgi:predicted transport protein